MAVWHCKQNITIKKMTTRTKNIIGWALSGIIVLMLIASAIDKIIGSEHALQMGASFGLSEGTYSLLGIIEILCVVLFLYPKTGILGTLLLSSYLGGAIATHLQHQQGIAFPTVIEAFVWIAAVVRFPELRQRLFKSTETNNAHYEEIPDGGQRLHRKDNSGQMLY
jgi:hypothetical protein